jgi:hypothetical protein
MKHFSLMTKPFFRAAQRGGNNIPVQTLTKRRTAATQPETPSMRALSLILAAALVVAGSSVAGSSESGLPGVGTFAYAGSALTPAAPEIVVLAAR